MLRAAMFVLWVIALIIFAGWAYSAERVGTALVFVVDCSNSMSLQEQAFVRAAHVGAITSPDVQQAIRESGGAAMAYVEFSGSYAITRIDWTLVTGPASAEAFVSSLRSDAACGIPNGNTPVWAGLAQALALFGSLPYPADRLVVDVIGDGQDNDGLENEDDVSDGVAIMRAALLAMGATINGLPMALDTTETYTLVPWYCGSDTQAPAVRGGYGSFCRSLENIADLPIELRQKIVQELY